MKKNYFYTTVREEFSLLLTAVRTSSESEIQSARKTCLFRHRGLCSHLLKDFITPIQRDDLYEISSSIFAVFSTLSHLSSVERNRAEQSVLLLATDPFRFDESMIRRREELWNLWGDVSALSPGGKECFFALDRVAERLLLAAVRNA